MVNKQGARTGGAHLDRKKNESLFAHWCLMPYNQLLAGMAEVAESAAPQAAGVAVKRSVKPRAPNEKEHKDKVDALTKEIETLEAELVCQWPLLTDIPTL